MWRPIAQVAYAVARVQDMMTDHFQDMTTGHAQISPSRYQWPYHAS
jgi:hypothetical protein